MSWRLRSGLWVALVVSATVSAAWLVHRDDRVLLVPGHNLSGTSSQQVCVDGHVEVVWTFHAGAADGHHIVAVTFSRTPASSTFTADTATATTVEHAGYVTLTATATWEDGVVAAGKADATIPAGECVSTSIVPAPTTAASPAPAPTTTASSPPAPTPSSKPTTTSPPAPTPSSTRPPAHALPVTR